MSAVHYEATGRLAQVDEVLSAAHHIAREYGNYGYRIGIAMAGYRASVFEVSHYDGSRFNVVADCWGNVTRIPDDATEDEARDIVQHAANMAGAV